MSQLSLKTLQKKRTSEFYKTEEGKKWFNYEGVASKQEEFRKSYNRWSVIQRNLKKNPNYKIGKPRGMRNVNYGKTKEELYKLQLSRQQEKIWCSCGKKIRMGYMLTHIITEKHKKEEKEILDNLPPPPQEWLDEIEKMEKLEKKKTKKKIIFKVLK